MGYDDFGDAEAARESCSHVRAEDCYEPGAHLKVQRRTLDVVREAYLEAEVPEVAKRFNCTEQEARLLLEETFATSWPRLLEAREASRRFILERTDDETLNFSIEFADQGGEDITTATYDQYGTAGMELLADTVKSIGEALGIEVIER